MTIEDVRSYESQLQTETNKRVTDGVNLEEANQPTSWLIMHISMFIVYDIMCFMVVVVIA